MARLRFRIVNLALDDEEEVREVTAIVRSDTHKVITGLVGDVAITQTGRGGTELTVVLPLVAALELFRACGRVTGLDPRHEHTTEIYDSLARVYYGLVAEE